MSTKIKTAPDSVYKALATKIRNTTEGLDYDEEKAEVQNNGHYYVVNYILERHYDEFDDEREYCEIINWRIEDSEGELVTTITMTPEEIEKHFDKRPNYSDKD